MIGKNRELNTIICPPKTLQIDEISECRIGQWLNTFNERNKIAKRTAFYYMACRFAPGNIALYGTVHCLVIITVIEKMHFVWFGFNAKTFLLEGERERVKEKNTKRGRRRRQAFDFHVENYRDVSVKPKCA